MNSLPSRQQTSHDTTKSASSSHRVYTEDGLLVLAALTVLFGVALFLLARATGSPLCLSLILLPGAATIALLRGNREVVKPLLVVTVIATVLLGLASVVASFGITFGGCFTDASTPPDGCDAARSRGNEALGAAGLFALCFLGSLGALFVPMWQDR